MADEQAPINAQDGGEQSDDQGRVFTQEELDRIVGDRLARERGKYADYDDLKAAAAKLKELEDANKTELEKAQEAREAAERAAQAALTAANERLMRAAFLAQAAQAGAAHPEDAYALADKAGVVVAEDGTVSGVDAAVAALVEAGRLVMSGRPAAPNLDGGAGGGDRPSEKAAKLTAEELEIAAKMGITPEEYAKYKQ